MPHACVMPVGTLWYLVDVVAENLPNFVYELSTSPSRLFRLDKESVLLVLGVNEFEWFAC